MSGEKKDENSVDEAKMEQEKSSVSQKCELPFESQTKKRRTEVPMIIEETKASFLVLLHFQSMDEWPLD